MLYMWDFFCAPGIIIYQLNLNFFDMCFFWFFVFVYSYGYLFIHLFIIIFLAEFGVDRRNAKCHINKGRKKKDTREEEAATLK